jgi:hypothetical protein
VVDLTAILDVAEADRFETFGHKPIRLEQVWSPNDTGLGGTCGATNVPWLECGLPDWLIQPVRDGAGCPFTGTVSCYDGPRLDILYEPGLGQRLGLGDGPVDLIGHFGDPASEGCRPENRAACRNRFVVTAIEPAGGDIAPSTPDEIRAFGVVATIVGGNVVYCSGAAVCGGPR